jgi:uncharacterized SAM-binding protein YcdF (DUF218 family)/lysophospholipase L1-like esterase
MRSIFRRERSTGRVGGFMFATVVGLVVVATTRFTINHTTVADWVVSPLVIADTSQPADAIVVAGAGVIGDCEPNRNGVQRVLLAARLFREKRGRIVVFTGGSGRPCPVAVAMARLARDIGVPPSAIWMETGSRSTWENAELSAPLLRALGVGRVLVVTDRLHARRAGGVFSQVGFEVARATVPIYAGHDDNVSMLMSGVREFVALAYYRSRGWLAHSESPGANPGRTALEAERVHTPAAIENPSGPLAIHGASYARGWPLDAVGDAAVINLGVAGEQSIELLNRFERDVVPLRPRAVILWGFINDIFRASPGDEAVLARVRDNYTQMVELARRHGIAPILATEVTVRPARSWQTTIASLLSPVLRRKSYQDRVNDDVIALNRWLVAFASREGLLLLDLQSTLSEAGGRRRPEFALDDGSHITTAGYAALTVYARPAIEDHLLVSHTGS